MTTVQHFLGGFAGGVASTVVCHPLDLLKVRYAANEGNLNRPVYRNYWHAVRSIVSSSGFRGLYQGLSPNLCGAALSWGLYFEFYYKIKGKVSSAHVTSGYEVVDNFLFGLLSGSCVMALTNPIWVAKTRLCLQYENSMHRYNGMFNCIHLTARNEGFKALYKGFIPGLFGTVHGALQFMIYNYMKDAKFRSLGVDCNIKLDFLDYVLYSATSKIIATSATYPYQVLRTRLQDHNADYRGLRDVIGRTFRNEGLMGFYKGILAANVRQVPATVVVYIVYENVKHLVGNT